MTELLLSSPASSSASQRGDEFEFVCSLVGAELAPERIERIANWNRSALDWSEVLRLAEHHGVLPLVARNLIEHARGLPAEVERTLRSAYEANLRRSLWFTVELARIMQHFGRRQLRAVPYKGAVLAQSLYRNLGLRSFSDLDFLISSTDFGRAKQALAEIGYRPAADLTPAVERLWLRTGYERAFDSAAGKNLVEVQWALLPYFYGVDLGVEDLMARAGRTVVGGCDVPCLAPEDSLLVLCLHAAKHLWTRLIWLSDIAETLQTQSQAQTIDYSLAFGRARALGIDRILGVSFWLVKNVLRVQLPQAAEEMITADPRVSALGAEFAARLLRGASYDFESTEYFRLILKLRERRGDRWRYLWRLVWTPGVGDVAAVQLPEALFPLYRIVRMGRLMRKLV
ncbi:MAG: nucleotidyltransferase family protein [Terriglobales bacterium]|jgi:hypothetical protein